MLYKYCRDSRNRKSRRGFSILIWMLIGVFAGFYTLSAQNTLAQIGGWKSYFPTGEFLQLEKGKESVIVANPYMLTLYYPDSEETLVLDKVNGLTQTGISVIRYDEGTGEIIVGYEDGNIDIVSPENTFNIPGIKNNQNIQGSRKINDIVITPGEIVLATDFGVVQIDRQSREFTSTLFTEDEILHIVYLEKDDLLAASSKTEIYFLENRADINPADITQWNILPPVFPGLIRDMVVWKNEIYLIVDRDLYLLTPSGDMTFLKVSNSAVTHIRAAEDFLLVINEFSNIITWDGVKSDQMVNVCLVGMTDVVMLSDHDYWYISRNDFGHYDRKNCSVVSLPGVPSKYVSEMALLDSRLFVATGGVTPIFGYLFREDGFYTNDQGGWKSYNLHTVPELKERDMRDIYSVTADDASGKVYLGTFWDGLIEYDKGKIQVYDSKNSALLPSVINPDRIRIADLFLDGDHHLWIANHDGDRPLVVKTNAGEWHNFKIPVKPAVERLVVDSYEQVWMDIGELGLLIYKPNDWDRDGDDESRLILPRPDVGDGTGFDNARINEIVLDQNGAVWVGTESGPVVFDCGNFAMDDLCQGRKPVIELDGRLGVLLRNENVTAIAIDPGNRKWLGTESGVYVVNDAVTAIDLHFHKGNAPLPSDNITDIAIDPKSGEVYIATEGGLVSYRGESTEAVPGRAEPMVVFPNPVTPEYSGSVGIRDLPQNALVRITTLSGRLIYEARAIGGQVTWNRQDRDGRKIASGIYLIFATADEGFSPFTKTGKVFIVN